MERRRIQFSHENEKGNATKNFYKTQREEREIGRRHRQTDDVQ